MPLARIYDIWMDLKDVFTGGDSQAILESCEYGEKAAQKCYADALNDQELPEEITNIIREQKQSIDNSRKEIRSLLIPDSQ
jgi:uncharacterized protein (TIGR02284 family)